MKKWMMGIAAGTMLLLGADAALASGLPATKKLSYQEEGMTETKAANFFNSKQGYKMYVISDYKASRVGAYDVFTLKADPKVWLSVTKLRPYDNFQKLAAPVKKQLAARVGQVYRSFTNGTLTLEASNLSQRTYEDYVYTNVHNQPYRFHIVHESDWESNAQFFAMIKSIQ